MSNTLLIKRSSTPNAVPSTGDLVAGELAINTYDGRLFTEINTGSPAIFELTQNQPITATGNVTGTSVNGVGNTSIALTLSTTGVSANTYGGTSGSSTNVGVFTVDQYGRITSASNVAISTASLSNGTSNIQIASSGNISLSVAGTSDVAVFASTGEYINGLLSVTGNVVGGNLNAGSGAISTTGNVVGGNVLFGSGIVSGTGNITGGNVLAGSGVISTGGNITGGNVLFGSGIVSGTGNISGGNLNATGLSLSGNVVSSFNVTGNIAGGNVTTPGLISSTGNITGGNIHTIGAVSASGNLSTLGNVLAGNVVSTTLIQGAIVSASGNVVGGNISTNGLITATGNINGGNLISAALVQGTTVSATANVIGGNITTAGDVSATGNLTGGNVNTNYVVGTGLTLTSTGNVNFAPTGNVVLNSTYINSVADPQQAQDAATKAYVDSVAQGLDVKASVTLGSTVALPAYTYFNGVSGVGATITGNANGTLSLDSTAVTANARVLIKNETLTNAPYNGIYIVTNTGNASSAFVLTRSTDFDAGAEIVNAFTFIEDGPTLADTGWVCTSSPPINVGSTNITFSQFSGAGTYSAGTGLTLTGTTFSVNASQTQITQVGDLNSLSVVGNTISGNLLTGGLISATGNVNGGNLIASTLVKGTTVSASGNVVSGNVNATNGVFATTGYFTGNVDVLGNLNATVGLVYANSGIFYGDVVTGNGAAYAGVPAFTPLGSNVVMQFGGNVNSYSQINFQNINSGNVASTDFIATADNGTDTTYYLDVGINSSTFDDPIDYPGFGPNDSYVHNHGGNLILNPESAGKSIKLMVGGTDTTDIVAQVQTGLVSVTGNISATGNIRGANLNAGSGVVSTTGNVVGGNLLAGSGVITTSGNITGGNVLFGSGIVSGTGNISGGNLFFDGGVVSGTGNIIAGNISTGGIANIATLEITTIANIKATTVSIDTASGALRVAGGAGIVGNVYAGAVYSGGEAVLTVNSTIDGGTY